MGILLFTVARPFMERLTGTPAGDLVGILVQRIAQEALRVVGPTTAGFLGEILAIAVLGGIVGGLLGGMSELMARK